MTTYQHAAPAPARSGGTDVAAWALVAIIVAAVCAFAGWAIARQDVLGHDDIARNAALAGQEGFVRGEATGYSQGARQGRREATARTNAQVGAARRQASREGYQAGYAEGRAKAGDPEAFLTGMYGGGAGAYPAAGYEEILAAGLFGADAPGFSDSAFDSYGYGSGISTDYVAPAGVLPTSLGDSY